MKTSIATVTLSGDLAGKLRAIAAAGFDGYELFEADLTSADISPEAVRQLNEELGLQLFALQPFRDFEGMLDQARGAAFSRAERKFDLMNRLNTDLLLIPSNCSALAADGLDRAAADLRELGERAAQRGYRVAYEALAWGRHVRDWPVAWEIVKRADHPNVGLVLDSYHLFVRGNSVAPIRNVPVEKIFIVQLADAPSLDMEVLRHSRHLRNFPGQGDYPIVDLLAELVAIGYDGVLSHEIFNDDFRTAPPTQTAIDGYRSMVWLEEQLLSRHRTPTILQDRLPEIGKWTNAPRPIATASVLDFSFIEFCVRDEEQNNELVSFLNRVGFRLTHRHRTKRVDLFGAGDVGGGAGGVGAGGVGGAWIAVTTEPASYTSEFAERRGTAVCGIGLLTDNANAMLERANVFGCDEVQRPRHHGEMTMPAIAGIGGALVYLVDENIEHFTITDFVPIDKSQSANQSANQPAVPHVRVRIDHIAHAVAPYELLSSLLFYRSVLGMHRQPALEFADLNGLVSSRTMLSPNGAVRIPLNTAASRSSSPELFRSQAHGSGVQHVAFATDSLTALLETIDPSVVLPIPANYYDDLVARYDLTESEVASLAANNLLYDRTESGEYFHLYTHEVQGFFFEFVQRINYAGFGAPNAPIRLAAQATSRSTTEDEQ